jgi:hypothetical protein
VVDDGFVSVERIGSGVKKNDIVIRVETDDLSLTWIKEPVLKKKAVSGKQRICRLLFSFVCLCLCLCCLPLDYNAFCRVYLADAVDSCCTES